jgi:predicted signal transduction protein with EAL and GGDEF domain
LEAEQVRLLYGAAGPALFNVITAAIVAVSFWEICPHWLMVAWPALFCLVVSARLVDRWQYLRNPAFTEHENVASPRHNRVFCHGLGLGWLCIVDDFDER